MKHLLTLFFSLALLITVKAQMHGGGHGNFDPDSLTETTLSGIVIIQNDFQHPQYFLDTNNDGAEDYFLNFGPYWYEPDSSNAIRPADGEQVTFIGGLHESINLEISTLVVYEINGEFWREPYYSYWNNFDGHGSGGHDGGCGGHTFGTQHDTLEYVLKEGTALVDTTFFMNHYYLDVDNDTTVDYFLNFGPWWYQPESGAVRPENGETVTIEGGFIDGVNFDIIVVYKINGQVWIDSSNFGNRIGGGWITNDMNDQRRFHNPYDTEDHFTVMPGWNQGGGHHGGGMMPNNLFTQMLELYPNNIPNAQGQGAFMAYEFGAFGENSNNMCGDGFNNHMGFSSQSNFQFHYNDIQIQGNEVDENSIEVKYWDGADNTWKTVSNVSVDKQSNTITYSSEDLYQYVIVTANKVTGIESTEEDALPSDFVLKQNYPNPFNPSTTIEFTLKSASEVNLSIYDVLGKKLTTLTDGILQAGTHEVNFEGQDISSGIYFYSLTVGNTKVVKKMTLAK